MFTARSSVPLESEPQLSLKLPVRVRFVRDISERVRRMPIERRIRGQRMVKAVGGVDADLQRFGFVEPERLADVRIEVPRTRILDRLPANVSAAAGLRILQHDLA